MVQLWFLSWVLQYNLPFMNQETRIKKNCSHDRQNIKCKIPKTVVMIIIWVSYLSKRICCMYCLSVCLSVEKDKACVRQWSAPQFNLNRRMTTKLNLGSSMFSGMNSCVYLSCLTIFLFSNILMDMYILFKKKNKWIKTGFK